MIAGMNDSVDDEDLKEEIMRCFSNIPTTIQAIGVLRGIKQSKLNHQMIHYASTLLPHPLKEDVKEVEFLPQVKDPEGSNGFFHGI